MMTKRRPLPKTTETAILTQCHRRCCLCFYLANVHGVRKGQIAHLNHDRTDHRPSNLAFLCFDHHDEFDSRTSQSKRLTASEVRFYRNQLNEHFRLLTTSPSSDAPPANCDQKVHLDISQLHELRRVASARANEWRRLREDFEREAKSYPDLKLMLVFIRDGEPLRSQRFALPNHVVTLWQFSPDIGALDAIAFSKMGMRGQQLSACAVLMGEKTELFVRMANRAGAMVPNELASEIAENVWRVWSVAGKKPLFVSNSNSLAKWLNFVLVATASFHPERLTSATLPVDPFAASLPAFDLVTRVAEEG